jgi:gliding motility-associated-like protein
MKSMKFIFFVLFSFLVFPLLADNNEVDKTSQAKEWLKNQPLNFIENKGQFADSEGNPADNVLFKASYGNCDIYITTEGLSYVFAKYEKVKGKSTDSTDFQRIPGEKALENKTVSYYRLDMNLQGSAINKSQIVKELPGKQGVTNYFYPHCPEGIYGVQEYGKITIKNIYNGIDWVIYTNANNKESPLKYDFVVHPQADYKDIKIKFINAQSTHLTDNGTKLKIQTIAGTIEEGNLYSYLQNSTEKQAIKTNYKANADSTLEFEIGAYDKFKTLVIDPLVWATYYGGNNMDNLYSICTDSDDNIYVTGGTNYTNFPTHPMPGAYVQPVNPGTGGVVLLKFNKDCVRLWATYYGGDYQDYATAICTDTKDNIYITGRTESSDFPLQTPINGGYFQINNAGRADAFILKFNKQGVRQWATLYGGGQIDYGTSICSDSQDNIYVTGVSFSYDLPTVQSLGAYYQPINTGGQDVFILKFDPQSALKWATYYGGYFGDLSSSIAVDSHDNIYITGQTSSYDFPTKQLAGAFYKDINGDVNGGQTNLFILKFNNQSVRLWATYYGGWVARGNSICVDSKDNIYIAGASQGDCPTQDLPGAYNQAVNNGNINAIILKFNNLGERKWATLYGGTNIDEAFCISSDKKDNIFITGRTYSPDFPTKQLIGEYWQEASAGSIDAFMLKFTSLGEQQWATYYGGGSWDEGLDIAVDNKNDIYIVGEFDGSGAYTIDYGNSAYYDDSWNGSSDGYILKINGCNNQKPTSIKTDRNNICINDNSNITLTAIGGIGDTLKWYSDNLGLIYIGKGTPLIIPSPTQTTTYYARWESQCDTSACDSIVINIYSQITQNISPIICQGDTCFVGTSKYTTTGVYTDLLISLSGCDSTVITNLFVNPIKQTIQFPVICQGESLTVGMNNYTSTGTYTDILKTYLACDSTVITNLIVNPTKQISLIHSICEGESFVVGTNVHTTTGIYSDTLVTISGCDSIISSILTVNPTKNTSDSPVICQGETVEVGTHIYSTTGIYSDTLNTILGCDSIVITNLTVGTKKQNTLIRSICTGEFFPIGIHNYTTTGIYVDTLATVYGCDSIITTNLTVIPTIQTAQSPSICEGENITVGTHIYTTTGTYTDVFKTVAGCDSIVTTDLTVNPLPLVSLGDDMLICPGDSIFLSPGEDFISYLWSDGSVLNKLLVLNPGIYTVTASNEWCPASDEITINDCGTELWFPNAFSPDNDGVNERFKPVILGTLNTYQILIFNRWGQQIYESTDAYTGWDGVFNGSPCANGLYVYIATYSMGTEPATQKQRIHRGTVMLVR